MPQTNGAIFQLFKQTQNPPLSPESEACAADTVDGLLATPTTDARPAMLLGQVQSGKTRTFVAAIALALDNGFDVAIVFTKGTKALTKQTVARLSKDLGRAVAAELVTVEDIRTIPDSLVEWELQKKLVIVCKKEDDNLDDLATFFNQYPQLIQRRVLIVDDEADFASVGYKRSGGAVIANVIPTQIDALRQQLPNVSFLQVTATPYALYLQPEDAPMPDNGISRPLRPAFTQLVPVHSSYIGGRVYFDESQDPESIAYYFHVPVDATELDILKTPHTFDAADEALASPAIAVLRQAVISFIVGAWIRRQQQIALHDALKRYSFIVHTETGKRAHEWQVEVVTQLINSISTACTSNPAVIEALVRASYDDLQPSLALSGSAFPTCDQVLAAFPGEIAAVKAITVNSEKQVEELLDDTGQLRLRTPYNIFVGGQILDRGITIDNLIGFYYGRRPKVSQADTVLQHSRMYGARPRTDLAVTRFYTTNGIYSSMQTIHDFDEALRETIETSGQDAGVIFLREDDSGRVVPCSPNKILRSTIISVRARSRQRIPAGFNTLDATATMSQTVTIDALLAPHFPEGESPNPRMISIALAAQILEGIAASLDTSESPWDLKGYVEVLRHLAGQNPDPSQREQVLCIVRRNRNQSRVRPNGRLQDAPDSASERTLAESTMPNAPCLLLYRQEGTVEQQWRGAPFWWPIVRAPRNTRPIIYAASE
jgi:hypothetical protein